MFLVHDTEDAKEALRVRNLFDYAHRAVFGEFGALTYPLLTLPWLSCEEPHHRTTIESPLNIHGDS